MVKLRIASPFTRMLPTSFPFDMEEMWGDIAVDRGLDVYEENDRVVVKAAVPGIPADKVQVTYEDGVLRIRAKAEESEEEKNKKSVVYRMERIATFDYATTFPRPIDANAIEARVEDGVVVVTAPIADAAKPKKIEVKATPKA